MIFVNFKNYERSLGEKAVKLAKVCDRTGRQTGIAVFPIVSSVDIFRVVKEVKIEVWAQHIDPKENDRNTGWVTALGVKRAGAKGIVINHSEHKLTFDDLKFCLEKGQLYGLKTMVCVDSFALAQKCDQLSPDFIAFEDPNLIAGEKAIVEFKKNQQIIKKLVATLKTDLLVGAGVQDRKDVKTSLGLGAKGVLVSSGVVKAVNPKKALLGLLQGFE